MGGCPHRHLAPGVLTPRAAKCRVGAPTVRRSHRGAAPRGWLQSCGAQFRKRALESHPDKHPESRRTWTTEEMQRINWAYKFLL